MAMAQEPSDIPVVPAKEPSRRRKPNTLFHVPGRESENGWTLTYMDTMTLLITLFVMFLSFANFEPERFAAFTDAMSLDKHKSDVVFGTIGRPALPMPRPLPDSAEVEAESDARRKGRNDNLVTDLEDQIDKQGLTSAVRLHRRSGKIEMEINEKVLFALGSAELSESGLNVLARLTPMLNSYPGRFSVEGHTDDLPIGTEHYPSNWELSGARASAVVRRLIAGGIPAERLRIVGYAATRPLTANATPEDRQKNRRVNIILELEDSRVPDGQ